MSISDSYCLSRVEVDCTFSWATHTCRCPYGPECILEHMNLAGFCRGAHQAMLPTTLPKPVYGQGHFGTLWSEGEAASFTVKRNHFSFWLFSSWLINLPRRLIWFHQLCSWKAERKNQSLSDMVAAFLWRITHGEQFTTGSPVCTYRAALPLWAT